jgi:WD40 repeat protein
VRDYITLISVTTYTGHLDTVAALCFDEVFNLYSTGYDGTIKKWNEASRSVAFSFENRNGSVSSLAVQHQQLLVGLKSGRIDFYTIDDGLYLNSVKYHSKEVSSLIVSNGSIYSSGLDGTVLRFLQADDRNFATIYRSNHKPMKDLSLGIFFWIALQGDSQIVYIPTNLRNESMKVIEFHAPLVCVAATDSVILAGSKLGIIYAWDIENMQLTFELKGHVSPVNNLFVVDDRLFSASDDKTIIEWSLESETAARTYKRLSASALGHLGAVNSLSFCSDTLFSAGSDLTVRRWSTVTGKHDDVYFGFSKSVTTVVCYNSSVLAGSEDFSVLMFKPSLPQNQDVLVKSTTSIARRATNQKKIVRLQRVETNSMNVSLVFISLSVTLVLIILVICGYVHLKKSPMKILSPSKKTTSIQETVSSQTVFDLETVVNSVMGISKHAAYLMENSSLATVKKLTAGGGGELFLARVMAASLRKKLGEIVVQKVVFVKNKISEEAFYQEVGIMILLSTFPNFCQILGYTENPLSMVLKNYVHGSLYDWIGKNVYATKIIIKVLKETAMALTTMHSHYLAHCDLKPQNILVEVENGLPSCYLTDFGITQILSEKIIATKSFQVINLRGLSAHYAAPEAFRNFRTKKYVRVDFKAYDIYSFGCIAYEVLTTRMPWH